MAATIRNVASGVEVRPDEWYDYEYQRTPRTIVHTLINSESPDITFRPASLRTGELHLLAFSHDTAQALENIFRWPGVLEFEEDQLPSANMTFVVVGSLSIGWNQGYEAWEVKAGYQEVAA